MVASGLMDRVVFIRPLTLSGDLDDYLDFHKARELDRNHLSRYEHGEVPSLQLPGKRKSLLRIVQ